MTIIMNNDRQSLIMPWISPLQILLRLGFSALFSSYLDRSPNSIYTGSFDRRQHFKCVNTIQIAEIIPMTAYIMNPSIGDGRTHNLVSNDGSSGFDSLSFDISTSFGGEITLAFEGTPNESN